MRESALEAKLVKAVKAVGGLCWKFTSPGMPGVPDRICIFPGGVTVFVEMKAPGGVTSVLQNKRLGDLWDRKAAAHKIDSVEGIEWLVRKYSGI